MTGKDIVKIPELETALADMAEELKEKGVLSERQKKRFRDEYSRIFPDNPDLPTTAVMDHYVRRYLNLIS